RSSTNSVAWRASACAGRRQSGELIGCAVGQRPDGQEAVRRRGILRVLRQESPFERVWEAGKVAGRQPEWDAAAESLLPADSRSLQRAEAGLQPFSRFVGAG